MRKDQGGRVCEDCDLEHLARFHDGGGQAADADLGQADDDVCCVEQDDQEFFPVFVAEIIHQYRGDVGWYRYLDAVGERQVRFADKPCCYKRELAEQAVLGGTFCASGGRHGDLLIALEGELGGMGLAVLEHG